MVAALRVKPGILRRIREIHSIPSDTIFAEKLGVSRATLVRVQGGVAPSPAFMAGLVRFSGLGLGEAFEITEHRGIAAAPAGLTQ